MKGIWIMVTIILAWASPSPSLGQSALWGSASMSSMARHRAMMADYDSLRISYSRWAEQQRRFPDTEMEGRGRFPDSLLLFWTEQGKIRSADQLALNPEAGPWPCLGTGSRDWEIEYREWEQLWSRWHRLCLERGSDPELLHAVIYWKAAFPRFEMEFEQELRFQENRYLRKGGRP